MKSLDKAEKKALDDINTRIRIGKNIQYLRKRLNLTSKQLAKELEIGESFITLVESGQRGMSLNNLTAVADYLNINLNDLIRKDLTAPTAFSEKDESGSTEKEMLVNLIKSLTQKECHFVINLIRDLKTLRSDDDIFYD